jgi:hypothetical protein
MKIHIKKWLNNWTLQEIIIALVMTLVISAVITGCTTTNPNAGQTTVTQTGAGPITNVEPPFVISPSLGAISNTVTGILGATAPINPYASLTTPLATLILTGIGLVSGYLVQKKNTTAALNTAATHAATINQLATSIAAQGNAVAQAVIDHASNNEGTAPAVFAAINAKLAPDKTTSAT